MGRPLKSNEEILLDAVLVMVDRDGKAATMAGIAVVVGTMVRSLYYRFANREVLLLALWVCSIRRFQINFLAAAGSSGNLGETLVVAVVAVPRYCREYLGEAGSLTLLRHEEVLTRLEAGGDGLAACPNDLREVARGFNDKVVMVMIDLTRRRFGSLESSEPVRIAVQQITYGLVCSFLGSGVGPVPAWLDDVVAVMAPATLTIADRPGWSKGRG